MGPKKHQEITKDIQKHNLKKRLLLIVGSVSNASQIIETDKYRKGFYALTSGISSISCSKCVVFC